MGAHSKDVMCVCVCDTCDCSADVGQCVAAVVEEAKYPCADYKPGDDDLQSFDFIRKFELGTD